MIVRERSDTAQFRKSVDEANARKKYFPETIQSDLGRLSTPLHKNIPTSLLTQITSIVSPSRPTEGRLAIVTDAGRDAVDAGSSGART
jgi:hypothetical protein